MDGVSQYEWSARWWTAVGEAAATDNPLHGASDSASLNLINAKSGRSSVYFLTGSADGGTINRSANISSSQHIFFAPLNYLEWKSYGPGFPDATAVCASATTTINSTKLNSIYATLDHSALTPDISAFRQSCAGQPNLAPAQPGSDGAFVASADAGSLFDAFGTTNPDLFASDGYWLMLNPLAAGTYELRFGGVFNDGGFVQDNTYTLQVFNPSVPGPLPALGVAAGYGFSRRLRKRINSSRQAGVNPDHLHPRCSEPEPASQS